MMISSLSVAQIWTLELFKDVVVRLRRDTAVWQAAADKGDKPSTARMSVVGFSVLPDAVVVREDLALIPRD